MSPGQDWLQAHHFCRFALPAPAAHGEPCGDHCRLIQNKGRIWGQLAWQGIEAEVAEALGRRGVRLRLVDQQTGVVAGYVRVEGDTLVRQLLVELMQAGQHNWRLRDEVAEVTRG